MSIHNVEGPTVNVLTEEEIFAAAIKKPLSERSLFLDRACAGDDALRKQVEALLAAIGGA